MDPTARADFFRDLSSAQQAVAWGVTASRAASADTHWTVWTDFCAELAVDPFLQGLDDPVPLLQVYMHRYRTGRIAPRGNPVRARSAEDAVRSVGQTFSAMGATDPRLTNQGKMDFRLTRQISCYKKEDPPPDRVKPVPVAVLYWILSAAATSQHPGTLAIADMIALAYFFLLRPGEYTATPSETTPFRLADLRLATGNAYLDIFQVPASQLNAATFATLTFTNQKNNYL